jgi:hypothetical protein
MSQHHCTPFEMLSVIVGGANGIPWGMGELQLNMLMRVLSFVQNG